MKRWIFAALGGLASMSALAGYTDKPPVFACDAAASRVAIWFEGRDVAFAVELGKTATALKVPSSRASKALTPAGSAYRLPGKTRLQRCGRLRLRLGSAFLNANPEGEAGVFEFPVVEIWDGAHRVLPRTALAICDDPPSRWDAFGRCPQDFATAIDVTASKASTPARVRVTRAHNTVDGQEVEERPGP